MPKPRRWWGARWWARMRGVPAADAAWDRALVRTAPRAPGGQTADARKAREALGEG